MPTAQTEGSEKIGDLTPLAPAEQVAPTSGSATQGDEQDQGDTDDGYVPDLDPVGVGTEKITHQTRAHIAKVLTWATILVAGIIGITCAACLGYVVLRKSIADLEKLTPLMTLLLSQTLVPLTTISITWYFASRQAGGQSGG